MADIFEYVKEEFETHILYHFKSGNKYTAAEIKRIVYEEIALDDDKFKADVFRRIISFRTGRDWWLEPKDFSKSTQVARELVAIWKIMVHIIESSYEDTSVEEFAQERLNDVEIDLADGKINEQTYIEKCNWIMKLKDIDEELLNVCSCCCIGSITPKVNEKLKIICLPCGWNKDSTCVKF